MSNLIHLGCFVNLTRTYHVFALPKRAAIEIHSSKTSASEPLGKAKRSRHGWQISWNILVDSTGRWQRDMTALLNEFMGEVSACG